MALTRSKYYKLTENERAFIFYISADLVVACSLVGTTTRIPTAARRSPSTAAKATRTTSRPKRNVWRSVVRKERQPELAASILQGRTSAKTATITTTTTITITTTTKVGTPTSMKTLATPKEEGLVSILATTSFSTHQCK